MELVMSLEVCVAFVSPALSTRRSFWCLALCPCLPACASSQNERWACLDHLIWKPLVLWARILNSKPAYKNLTNRGQDTLLLPHSDILLFTSFTSTFLPSGDLNPFGNLPLSTRAPSCLVAVDVHEFSLSPFKGILVHGHHCILWQ